MKAFLAALVVSFSFAGASQAASERCQIVTKSAATTTTVSSRSNVFYKGISFKDCYQKATEEIATRSIGDSLMVKHVSRAGIIKVFKLERNTSAEFDQYYLY